MCEQGQNGGVSEYTDDEDDDEEGEGEEDNTAGTDNPEYYNRLMVIKYLYYFSLRKFKSLWYFGNIFN
jgi:hypothetical protein